MIGTPPGHGSPGTVTVHAMGGLGNQLFIYAAGLAAATSASAGLRVDLSQHAARTDRPSLLQDIGLPAEYVIVPSDVSAVRRRLSRRNDAPPNGCTYRESSYRYSAEVLQQPAGSCLFGYFQSWQYVEPVGDFMRGHLLGRLPDRLHDHDAALRKIKDESAVVLHVRRGDYLAEGARGFHGVASPDYYLNAVHLLRRAGLGGRVFVMSDDVPAALQELSPYLAAEPLLERPADPLTELLLMSQATALVTANSSFSWWAGWLGDDRRGIVVAPRPWFDDPVVDSRDLLPPHWPTLERRSRAEATAGHPQRSRST